MARRGIMPNEYTARVLGRTPEVLSRQRTAELGRLQATVSWAAEQCEACAMWKKLFGGLSGLADATEKVLSEKLTARDQALLGYVEDESGAYDEAEKTLLVLIKRFPESRYAPEAHLRLGEYYFENGQWDDAENYTDENENGQWDEGENYTDENGNGIWDAYGLTDNLENMMQIEFIDEFDPIGLSIIEEELGMSFFKLDLSDISIDEQILAEETTTNLGDNLPPSPLIDINEPVNLPAIDNSLICKVNGK